MIDIVYITDDLSVNHMLNFEYLMTENINKIENPKQWIGGEYYIQTCLFLLLEKKFKNNYIKLTLKENSKIINNILDETKIIIFPGWTNDINENNLQFYKYKNKLYSYIYFIHNFKNMTPLTSHKFNPNITSLYFYVIPFKNNDDNTNYDNNIKGLLMGKCISHNINIFDKILNILNIFDENKIKLYSTIRDLEKMDIFPTYLENRRDEYIKASNIIKNHKSIELLGIINPKKFRKLLQHCKYILCFDNPTSPPTIIEALFSDCIIIAPSIMISYDLQTNKNIYLTDNMTNDEIILLIKKIENNEIIFDKNHYPKNYTEESMEKILKTLITF